MADRRPVTWPDLALTAVLLFVGLNGTGPAAANQGETVPAAGYVLVVAACLPILVWRWRPLWTLVGTGGAVAVYLALGYAYGPILFPLVVAVFGYAVRATVRRTAVATGVLTVAAVGGALAVGGRDWVELVTGAVVAVAWLVLPAAVGVVVKVRREAAAEVRAEQARRRVSEERLRLAQEVHDVVGHSLAVIAMQAGVALRVLDRDPQRARHAIEAVRSTSTEALDGLRAELDTLRQVAPGEKSTEAEPSGVGAPRRPRTGLAELPVLVDRFRDSGLPVTFESSGADPADLTPEVDHAAYRVVQEALTNVLRHGGADAAAQVHVARQSGAVQVEVTNTGAAPATGDTGHGIAGMRERAQALGGALEAGPRPGGGFAVRARLPAAGADRGAGGDRGAGAT